MEPRITQNMSAENMSVISFRGLVTPWICTKPDVDIGIDLIVDPLSPLTTDRTDSAIPLGTQFLVQLKSTSAKRRKSGKILTQRVSVGHLRQWKRRTEPVLLACYCIPEKRFYYKWIDEKVTISEGKTMALALTEWVDQSDSECFHQRVANYLYFRNLEFGVPKTGKDGSLIISMPDFPNYGSDEFKKHFPQTLLEIDSRARLENSLSFSEREIAKNPEDMKFVIGKALVLMRLKKLPDAHRFLKAYWDSKRVPEARILQLAIENDFSEQVLNHDLDFCMYVRWQQVVSLESGIDIFVLVNGEQRKLPEYHEDGVVIPVKIGDQFSFSFKEGNSPQSIGPLFEVGMSMAQKNGRPIKSLRVPLAKNSSEVRKKLG